MIPEERARVTFFWDRLRGVGQGVIEPVWQTFALVIAIRIFGAPDFVKALLPAAFPVGYLLVPLFLSLAARFALRASVQCAGYMFISGVCLGIGAIASSLWLYIGAVAISFIISSQVVPLMTQIYVSNYSPSERGSRFSTALLIATLVAVLVSYGGGRLLDYRLSLYPLLLLTAAAAAVFIGFAFSRIPTDVLPPSDDRRLSRSLGLVWRDRLFGWLLLGWMLLATGSMMTFPIRVEYIANPRFNIDATNEQIGIILGAIPLVTRLVSTKVWGYLFDRINLITLRIILNAITFVSIYLFFCSTNLYLMGFAMGLSGVGFGGGRILWQLWVTKLAPEGQITEYMSVNSAVMGLQGLVAPFLGYFLIRETDASFTSWIACALLGVSTIVFLPTRRLLARRQRMRT